MKDETNWKKFLTEEVLKECWHESKITENSSCSCGRPYHLGMPYDHYNRTFGYRDDLLDLVEEMNDAGKWEDFMVFLGLDYYNKIKYCCSDNEKMPQDVFLFCLAGIGYKDRCKLVAEFYGWKEGKK